MGKALHQVHKSNQAKLLSFTSNIRRLATLQGMLWITPRYLAYGLFAGQSVAFKSTKGGGFQDLFEAMIEDQEINIIHNFDVQVKV